jgi:hypothetical protein
MKKEQNLIFRSLNEPKRGEGCKKLILKGE